MEMIKGMARQMKEEPHQAVSPKQARIDKANYFKILQERFSKFLNSA
jgi:hypothetical protein